MSRVQAAHDGGRAHLRPVAMTVPVAGFGFVPTRLGHGMGVEAQNPLATVVIGDLISADPVRPATVYAWLGGWGGIRCIDRSTAWTGPCFDQSGQA